MKKKISVVLVLLILVSIAAQFIFLKGFDTTDLKGLNINIMVSIVTMLVTILIIDNLIQLHETRRKVRDYFTLLDSSHQQLVARLSNLYLHIVTKDTYHTDLDNVVENLEQYIDQDFVRKEVKVLIVNPNSIFEHTEGEVDYFTFCTEFKNNVATLITQYLNRYASIIPSEIMVHILKIDDLLKSHMLVSITDYGIQDSNIDIENIQFNPEDFIDIFKSIGLEILALKECKNTYLSR